MSKRFNLILGYLAHYKYLITIAIGVILVGVVDENSVKQHILYKIQIHELRAETERYNQQNESDKKTLREMRQGPKAYEKIARERYFMKADDEDIFVLSTDLPDMSAKDTETDETIE